MSFMPLEQLSRLFDGYQKPFNVHGHSLLLCQLDGEVFIIENRCPHMDVALTTATQLPNKCLRCRAHGIEFDLVSGKARGPLASTLAPVKKYFPVYEGTQVGVDLSQLR